MLCSSFVIARNSCQLLVGVNPSIVVDLQIAGNGSSNVRHENESPHVVNLRSSDQAFVLGGPENQNGHGNRWVVTSSALDVQHTDLRVKGNGDCKGPEDGV